MSGDTQNATAYWQAWTESLVQLLSQLSGAPWSSAAESSPGSIVPAVRARVTSTRLPSEATILLAAADLGTLLSLFLGEQVSVTGALDEMQREALAELLRQWCGLASTALKPAFGEMTLQVTVDAGVSQLDPKLGKILCANDSSRTVAVFLQPDDALLQWLRGPNDPLPPPPPAISTSTDTHIGQLFREGNLELLMDIELPVMLRFGSRQATLREVLDMATGAVLELDRQIEEPVDLVLNDKVIARGEVVVIDGDFGLHVTEVANPQQRVSSLSIGV